MISLKKQLVTFLSMHADPTQLACVLKQLLSPKEFDDIAARLEILIRLHRGDSQRTVAKDLSLGVATVTRGSRVLQEAPEMHRFLDTLS